MQIMTPAVMPTLDPSAIGLTMAPDPAPPVEAMAEPSEATGGVVGTEGAIA